jgi:hypothetical protein
MHPLQTTFATAEGENAWCDTLRRLIERARFAEAEKMLVEALAELDTEMGELCRAAGAAGITISGWPELAERIELHEGDEPITGLTIAIGNDGDLDFEKGRLLAPYMMLGLYTDEAWDWSGATREVLLAECAGDSPAWAGTDEDLEAFLEIEGLAALNTALIHSKQRHFIREGGETQAPLRYVEYIIGCWWRALRFHQAVAAAEAAHPLPGRVTIVSGMVDMRPDVVAVHLPGPAATAPAVGAVKPAVALSLVVGSGRDEATPPVTLVDEAAADAADQDKVEPEAPTLDLVSRGMISRKPLEEEKPVSGADLRRRIAGEPANDADAPRRGGFIARLFGRA